MIILNIPFCTNVRIIIERSKVRYVKSRGLIGISLLGKATWGHLLQENIIRGTGRDFLFPRSSSYHIIITTSEILHLEIFVIKTAISNTPNVAIVAMLTEPVTLMVNKNAKRSLIAVFTSTRQGV